MIVKEEKKVRQIYDGEKRVYKVYVGEELLYNCYVIPTKDTVFLSSSGKGDMGVKSNTSWFIDDLIGLLTSDGLPLYSSDAKLCAKG